MYSNEKIGFSIVTLLGVFFISFPFVNWEYKNLVLMVIGILFIVWTGWAVISSIVNNYKIIAKKS